MPRIGFATCRTWPDVSASDAFLQAALERRGVSVTALPWNDPEAAREDVDALILRSCWDYHHDLDGFLAWISGLERAGRAVWNPPPLVRWNASKRYLLDLAGSGVPTPETVVLDGGADLPGLMDARGWARAVVKPMVSASAHDTTLVARAEAEAVGRALDAGAIRRPALIQPFVEEIGERGLRGAADGARADRARPVPRGGPRGRRAAGRGAAGARPRVSRPPRPSEPGAPSGRMGGGRRRSAAR